MLSVADLFTIYCLILQLDTTDGESQLLLLILFIQITVVGLILLETPTKCLLTFETPCTLLH